MGCLGNESSFSASRTRVGHFISSNGELVPFVHIPCFRLNLIFASRSDNISITLLTTSTLPLSTARRNKLGKPEEQIHHSHHILRYTKCNKKND